MREHGVEREREKIKKKNNERPRPKVHQNIERDEVRGKENESTE